MQKNKEQFSNRWGIVLASLGMAIGAGNLWRFPRLAGQYGGSFILLWIFFLLIWAIPILMAEFSIGKKFRNGVIGAFSKFGGKSFAWGGFFITVCSLGIAFYYAVVTGWALKYLGFSISNLSNSISNRPTISDHLANNPNYLEEFWNHVAYANYKVVLLYIFSILFGVFLLTKSIQKGLERANRILIPSLFVLLIIITFVSLRMENGIKGLEYMFKIDFSHFSNPAIWIEALSQSAWSTGAGWGLVMTISSYSRDKEDVVLNTFISGFGNNVASIIAGMALLPAIFAIATTENEAINFLQSGNQALIFTIIPKLFSTIPGGSILSFIFFLTFFMAAFSSLLPMLELFLSNLKNLGMSRISAGIRVIFFSIIFGFPSAWSLDIFNNQDWVWGVGLIISGFLITVAVIKYKIVLFKKDFIDDNTTIKIPLSYLYITFFVNLLMAVVLIYWWLSRGYSQYPWFDENGYWNFFDTYSNASILTQWFIVLLLGILLNKYLYKKFVGS